ncbi:MAG: PDGLE domain-containing protein [Veillonellales bacterium]
MIRRCWILLIVLALLTPLGMLAEGTAWGEWGADDLTAVVGYVPQGIEQADSWWKAVFPDYSLKFIGEGEAAGKIGYLLSAGIGAGLIYLLMTVYTRLVVGRRTLPVPEKKG